MMQRPHLTKEKEHRRKILRGEERPTLNALQQCLMQVFALPAPTCSLVEKEKDRLIGATNVPDRNETMHWTGLAIVCLTDSNELLAQSALTVLWEVIQQQLSGSRHQGYIRLLQDLQEQLREHYGDRLPALSD